MPTPRIREVVFTLAAYLDKTDSGIASQSELARRSGVTSVTVNRIYHNKTRQVSLATLGALAAALGCAPGDLIGWEKRGTRK